MRLLFLLPVDDNPPAYLPDCSSGWSVGVLVTLPQAGLESFHALAITPASML
jgi:hypothetical protein